MVDYLLISYADTEKWIARCFARQLNEDGFYTCSAKTMRIGDLRQEALIDNILSSAGLVLLVTPDYLASANNQQHWRTASNYSVPVYPVLLKQCALPNELQGIHVLRNAYYDGDMIDRSDCEFLANKLVRELGKEHPAYSEELYDYYLFRWSIRNKTEELEELTSGGLPGLMRYVIQPWKMIKLHKSINYSKSQYLELRKEIKKDYTAERSSRW